MTRQRVVVAVKLYRLNALEINREGDEDLQADMSRP